MLTLNEQNVETKREALKMNSVCKNEGWITWKRVNWWVEEEEGTW